MAGKRTSRPRPPADLSEIGRVEFHRVVGVLEAGGRLETADPALIEVYARTYDAFRAAAARVSSDGAVVTHPNDTRSVSPDFKVMQALARLLRGLLRDLGLTPAARAALKVGEAGEPEGVEV